MDGGSQLCITQGSKNREYSPNGPHHQRQAKWTCIHENTLQKNKKQTYKWVSVYSENSAILFTTHVHVREKSSMTALHRLQWQQNNSSKTDTIAF